MKVNTVTSLQEIKLDHEKVCELCGKTYEIIQRIYGRANAWGGISSRVTDLQRDADAAIPRDLREKDARLLPYHRCTECGRYGPSSLEQMREEGFRKYRKHAQEVWRASLVSLLAFLSGLGYCLVARESIGYLITMTAFSLISGLALIVSWPISAKAWSAKVDQINSPEIVSKWLARWNEKEAKESRRRTQDREYVARESSWKYIKSIQHYLDPQWTSDYF